MKILSTSHQARLIKTGLISIALTTILPATLQSQWDSNNSTTSAREVNSGDSTTTDQHLTALNGNTAAASTLSAILPPSSSDSVSED